MCIRDRSNSTATPNAQHIELRARRWSIVVINCCNHVLTCRRKNQPFVRESITVHRETIAAVAAATHATADHEMSQSEPVEEVIFAERRPHKENIKLALPVSFLSVLPARR